MAIFSSLFHVGQVLEKRIEESLDPAIATNAVVVGAPLENAASTTDQVRLTLLWTTEQPTHRNDVWERQFDGSLKPPPLSLSAFYLITTYGNTGQGATVRAHQMLGNILQTFYSQPELSLPLASLPGRGEGRLGVVLQPMTPELMEKIFTTLQVKHRPHALLEVSPIQLAHQAQDTAPQPVVIPGGATLSGPTAATRPALTRVTPASAAVGARIRVDGVFPAALTRIWVGSVAIDATTAVPPVLQVLEPGKTFVLQLPTTPPDDVPEGVHNLSVATGKLASEPTQLEVVAGTEATLQAPATLTQSRAAVLVLQGSGLSGALEVVAWPDRDIASPGELQHLALSGGSGTQVTVAAASLSVLSDGPWRFAVRVQTHVYTPYILLEVVP